jgi:hypothetical protein
MRTQAGREGTRHIGSQSRLGAKDRQIQASADPFSYDRQRHTSSPAFNKEDCVEEASLSTMCSSDALIAAVEHKPCSFSPGNTSQSPPQAPGAPLPGGHVSILVPTPSRSWAFPQGKQPPCTHCFLLNAVLVVPAREQTLRPLSSPTAPLNNALLARNYIDPHPSLKNQPIPSRFATSLQALIPCSPAQDSASAISPNTYNARTHLIIRNRDLNPSFVNTLHRNMQFHSRSLT